MTFTDYPRSVSDRKRAAYWFAVGVVEEQMRVYRMLGHLAGSEEPVELSQEFSEYAEAQAVDYYDPSHPRFNLKSVPDQWSDFVKACHEAVSA